MSRGRLHKEIYSIRKSHTISLMVGGKLHTKSIHTMGTSYTSTPETPCAEAPAMRRCGPPIAPTHELTATAGMQNITKGTWGEALPVTRTPNLQCLASSGALWWEEIDFDMDA